MHAAVLRGAPVCDVSSGCSFLTGPWTVTRASLRMWRGVAAFCRPPGSLVLPLLRLRGPVVGALGVCAGCCGGRFTLGGRDSRVWREQQQRVIGESEKGGGESKEWAFERAKDGGGGTVMKRQSPTWGGGGVDCTTQL